MKLPKGVIMIPLDDPAILHETLAEIFNDNPNARRDVRKIDGAPSKGPGGSSDDGPSSPSK